MNMLGLLRGTHTTIPKSKGSIFWLNFRLGLPAKEIDPNGTPQPFHAIFAVGDYRGEFAMTADQMQILADGAVDLLDKYYHRGEEPT